MPNNPGKIDWKKRLALMKQGHANEPSQPVVTSPEPPIRELFGFREVPGRKSEPEPPLDLKPTPEAEREPVSNEAQGIRPTGTSQEPAVFMPNSHEGRLDNLERQIQSQKLMGNVALSLAILLLLILPVLLGKGSGRIGRIIADNFTITDAKGIGRVWAGEREGQGSVELRDQAGRRRLSLGLDAAGEPRLTFYNKDQKIQSEIMPPPDGQSGINLSNQSGESVLPSPPPNPPAPAVPEPQALVSSSTPIPQPEQVTREAPQVEPKSETKPETGVKEAESAIILASPKAKNYHLPNCPWIKNITPDKLVKFTSAAEAAEAGYYPCRRCRPDKN